MIARQSTRLLWESKGPRGFVTDVLHLAGLVDRQCRRYPSRNARALHEARDPLDSQGKPMPRVPLSEFSLRSLAEGVMGEDWADKLSPDLVRRVVLEAQARAVPEAAGTGAIMASQFADINAFTAVVAGLLEISVLEGWKNPAFIADELAPAESTKMFEGRKVIGVTRAGDVGEERLPGMPTKRAQIGERWISQPRTIERALACEVTQEAVFLDLTGEVLQEANDLGTWVGWHHEIDTIDNWIGVLNTYSYKGTTYNSWQTNGTWNNDLAGNELNHWTNIESAEVLFRDMLDPETNTRVLIEPNTILVNREKLHTANAIVGAREVEYRDAPGSTVNPQQVRHFANPISGYKVIQSPLVYQRLTDGPAAPRRGGLGLSANVAGRYWWIFERGKAMRTAVNWPMRVQQAAPNQADMIDRGTVLFVKCDERSVAMWYEPRRAVRCKP